MTNYRYDIDIWVTEAAVAKYPEDKYPPLYFDPPDEEGDLCSCGIELKHQYEPLADVVARSGIDPADIVMIQKLWSDADDDCPELIAAPRVFFKESWAEYYLWFKEDEEHALDIQLEPGSEQLLEQLGYERFERSDNDPIFDIPYGKYEVFETGVIMITHEFPDRWHLNADWEGWSKAEPNMELCKVLRIPADAVIATFMNG